MYLLLCHCCLVSSYNHNRKLLLWGRKGRASSFTMQVHLLAVSDLGFASWGYIGSRLVRVMVSKFHLRVLTHLKVAAVHSPILSDTKQAECM